MSWLKQNPIEIPPPLFFRFYIKTNKEQHSCGRSSGSVAVRLSVKSVSTGTEAGGGDDVCGFLASSRPQLYSRLAGLL